MRTIGIFVRINADGLATGTDTPVQLPVFGVRDHVRIRESARSAHQVNEHLVCDADDDVLSDIGVIEHNRR